MACQELARSRDIARLIAIIHPENRPSLRVAEKIGLSAETDTVSDVGPPVRVYAAQL